jgi:hypothetical protein
MEGVVPERLSDGERSERAYEFAARHLAEEFHSAAVVEHEKLGLYAARGLIGTGIAGGSDDITRVVKLLEERGIRLKGEHVALVVGLSTRKCGSQTPRRSASSSASLNVQWQPPAT